MNGTELSGSAAENAAELNNAEPVDRATIAPVTDVHAHVMITGLEDSVRRRAPQEFALAGELDLRRNGAESAAVSGEMIGSRIAKLTRLDTRIADMDAQGVDVQWVSPSPSHYYPWADEDLATWTVREANLRVAELVASAPSRLLGLGLVPLQHPERIVECVDDAVLGRGLIGVEIPSFAGDVELSDDRLEPFWARMEALGAIVFLHPFGCSLDERLDRFYLSNTVGQPVETATALSHLIFAGVLDRHPKLKVVAAHGGGYLPTTIGRSDHAWNVREDAQGCAEPPSSYLRRIWYDTVVHDARQLRHLIEVVEADRVVLGSDYPFDMGLDDPAHEVAGMLSTEGFDNEITDALLRSNAAAMLSPTTVSAQERTRQ